MVLDCHTRRLARKDGQGDWIATGEYTLAKTEGDWTAIPAAVMMIIRLIIPDIAFLGKMPSFIPTG